MNLKLVVEDERKRPSPRCRGENRTANHAGMKSARRRRDDNGSRGVEVQNQREGSVHQLKQATGHRAGLDVLSGDKNSRNFKVQVVKYRCSHAREDVD